MTKDKILNLKATIFILSIYLIGQLYEYYNGNGIKVDWWPAYDPTNAEGKYSPMPQSWAVKFLCEEINWIIITVITWFAIVFKGDKKRLLISIYVMIIWRCIDLGVWFYNFKTYGYGYVIAFVGLLEAFWIHRYDKKHKKSP